MIKNKCKSNFFIFKFPLIKHLNVTTCLDFNRSFRGKKKRILFSKFKHCTDENEGVKKKMTWFFSEWLRIIYVKKKNKKKELNTTLKHQSMGLYYGYLFFPSENYQNFLNKWKWRICLIRAKLLKIFINFNCCNSFRLKFIYCIRLKPQALNNPIEGITPTLVSDHFFALLNDDDKRCIKVQA